MTPSSDHSTARLVLAEVTEPDASLRNSVCSRKKTCIQLLRKSREILVRPWYVAGDMMWYLGETHLSLADKFSEDTTHGNHSLPWGWKAGTRFAQQLLFLMSSVRGERGNNSKMGIWVQMKKRTKKESATRIWVDWNKEAGEQRAGSIKRREEVATKMCCWGKSGPEIWL